MPDERPDDVALDVALDEFERALVHAVADAAPAMAVALHAHARGATVVRRDREWDGVTTYVCVPAGAPRLEPGEQTIRVAAAVEGLATPATVELSVHNGWLDSVMMSAPGIAWPPHPRLAGVSLES